MIISGDVSKEDLTEINELLAVEVGKTIGPVYGIVLKGQ